MSTESVLFVVYEFPPEGARGTKRSLKFIRYLPQNRWRPVILTVRSPNYSFHDGSLVEELPQDLPIYRARTLESFFTSRRTERPNQSTKESPLKGEVRPSIFRRMALWLYHAVGKFAAIPDSRILWLPFAVAKGLRAIRETHCCVIYTSGPTHTNHIVGAILSWLTRLPLVLDFRDAWVGNPAKNENCLVRAANAFVEKLCIRRAKQVICTTEGIQADFETRYPRLPKKYVTITNGFDSSDFPIEHGTRPAAPAGPLTIVHAGTLGGERSPKEFLMALGQLLVESPEIKSKLEVIFVGQSSLFADGRTIEQYISEYRCGSVTRLTGFVSRKLSLEYISRADHLLLIIGRVPADGAFVYGISGKIYDYAAARKPVLTISEPGSTAEMAQRLNLGPVVHPDRTQEMKSTLRLLLRAHAADEAIPYNPNVELLKSFEFSSLTARLAQCFEQVSSARVTRADETRLVQGTAGRL